MRRFPESSLECTFLQIVVQNPENSKELVAEDSGHFIIIDRPDVVIDAISQAVQSVRKNSKL
jgi:hypothetical protein